jgi:hypothetical protein
MMPRRDFLAAAGLTAGLSSAVPAAGETAAPTILEIRRLQMRNSPDGEFEHTQAFFADTVVPGLARAGASSIGVFRGGIGPDAPFVLMVTEFASLAALDAAGMAFWGDAGVRKAYAAYTSSSPRVYEREEVSLLRSFPGFAALKTPAAKSSGSHVFELRRYESPNGITLQRKIGMFDNGEAAIFERLGMKPVFFGETIVGTNMPNLTYMLCFDSLAAREELWSKFVSDPEWKKISAPPEMHDSEIVSNISNWILEPLACSRIR